MNLANYMTMMQLGKFDLSLLLRDGIDKFKTFKAWVELNNLNVEMDEHKVISGVIKYSDDEVAYRE
jgi:hypothetical protein